MRVVVEPKRAASADVVLNALYQHTALQSRFSVNMVAIVDGQPQQLKLKQFLEHFLEFRRDVVAKRARCMRYQCLLGCCSIDCHLAGQLSSMQAVTIAAPGKLGPDD